MANMKQSMRFGKQTLTAITATILTWASGCGLQPTIDAGIDQTVVECDAVRLEAVKGRIRSDCRLTGGRWLGATSGSTPPVLLLRGIGLGRSKRHFAALDDFCTSDSNS